MSALCQKRTSAQLFDHLVGASEQLGRNGETQCLRSFQVDDQLELGRLYHRQIGGLFAFENAADINAGLAPCICEAAAIAHQAAGLGIFADVVNRGNFITRRERDKLTTGRGKDGIGTDNQCTDFCLTDSREGCVNFTLTADIRNVKAQSQFLDCLFHILDLSFGQSTSRVDEQANIGHPRCNFPQQLQLLCRERGSDEGYTGDIPARSIETGNETITDWISTVCKYDWNFT